MIEKPSVDAMKEEGIIKEESINTSFKDLYYDNIDIKHAEIMESLALPCRSKKSGFKVTDKLEAIDIYAQKTEYKSFKTPHVWMYAKKGYDKHKDDIVLISSHCDMVKQITKPFSKLEDDGYYHGTYDNLGTNAAAVIMMLENNLPENVIFAFTADEETGRCNGANMAVELLDKIGLGSPTVISLDVTEEGYDEGALATIENVGLKGKASFNEKAFNLTANLMKELAIDNGLLFVPNYNNDYPKSIDKSLIVKSRSEFDEGYAYTLKGCVAFSLCLPSEGYMHSNEGLTIRQPVFEGYLNYLKGCIYEITQCHAIESIKLENKELLNRVGILIEKEKSEKKSQPRHYYDDFYDNTYSSPYEYFETLHPESEDEQELICLTADEVYYQWGIDFKKEEFVQEVLYQCFPDEMEKIKAATQIIEDYYNNQKSYEEDYNDNIQEQDTDQWREWADNEIDYSEFV